MFVFITVLLMVTSCEGQIVLLVSNMCTNDMYCLMLECNYVMYICEINYYITILYYYITIEGFP